MSWLARPRNSLAYRSSAAYRRLLRLLPPPARREREVLPLSFVTFGGAAHLPMIEQCLTSLYLAWPRLPHLRIVSDGSLGARAAAAALRWWPGPLEIVDWRDLLPAGNDDRLARFAAREPMGRKLAAIVAGAAAGPTLYCDVDVLWFRFPARLAELVSRGGTALVMSEDLQPMYDPALVPGLFPELATPPFYCAGLLYACGDFLGGVEGLDPLWDHAAERGIGVTEQTLLAEADRQLGGERWTLAEIALEVEDRFSLAPSYRRRTWSARHYVGQVRHIFYRDALALRLAPPRTLRD